MIRTFFFFFLLISVGVVGQSSSRTSSSDIYLRLKKLNVLGSVLYVAAHPDDENSRLIAFLSNERLYRTGYLSITRGDGGQNLIGDEQGIALGMIRTQELLAARRIDGGEQFFTRGYDFGYSKSTEEALKIWEKEKVLSDVVWVIRKFQPDVIITRFPPDDRAGHGHHSASAVLAHEAFKAAADPSRYPEQLEHGVKPWRPTRLVWNTYRFGSTNTTGDDQISIDAGGYNPLLGKSYGEIAADSRSQHKSQGFGVASSRGAQLEYFAFTDGQPAKADIFESINTSWSRLPGSEKIASLVNELITNYSFINPERSVTGLVRLYQEVSKLGNVHWRSVKQKEIQHLIEDVSGLWLEATSNSQFAVRGDSLRIQATVNSRLAPGISLVRMTVANWDTTLNKTLTTNTNYSLSRSMLVPSQTPLTQPYWIQKPLTGGSFDVQDQRLIGKPESDPSLEASFHVLIEGHPFVFKKPVYHKFSDPVKGEVIQPLVVVPPVMVSTEPDIVIFRQNDKASQDVIIRILANKSLNDYQAAISKKLTHDNATKKDSSFSLSKGSSRDFTFSVSPQQLKNLSNDILHPFITLSGKDPFSANLNMTSIKYDHIPEINYYYEDVIPVLNMDLNTAGKKVGYIEGAGDRIPAALHQMGYEVTMLKEADLHEDYLKQFDAIITGVRAFNVHNFLSEKSPVLSAYVQQGGNLIVQYNTNSFVGPLRTSIGPVPFAISRNRVADENSQVRFLLPDHPVLNYPNKITQKDFEGWVQERAIYMADRFDEKFEAPLSLSDPGESDQKGALIISPHGKGKFVYTGLVFFRQLPAGVPGAYRLLANIIALNKKKSM